VLYQQPRNGLLACEGIVFASPAMIFTAQGLMLGAGTILVAAEGARKLQSLKGREQRVLALLSAAYGRAVAPSVLGNIERAAKSWRAGDDFTAHLHLAHSGLRALDDFPLAAHRLRMAKGALDHGATPLAIFQALRLDARYIDTIEKLYNPAQPRVPAGHPDGGQWTSGDWSGAASASSQQVLSDATPDTAWRPGAQYAALEAGIHADTSIVDILHEHSLSQLLSNSIEYAGESENMHTIELNAANWKTVLDFYRALLTAVGAPKWHGESPDALIDSMIWGGINAIDPPYTIKISGVRSVPKDVYEHINLVKRAFADARTEYRRRRNADIDVTIETDA